MQALSQELQLPTVTKGQVLLDSKGCMHMQISYFAPQQDLDFREMHIR